MIAESATVGTAEPLTIFDIERSVSVAWFAAAMRLRRMMSATAVPMMAMIAAAPPAIRGTGIDEAAGILMATTPPMLSSESVMSRFIFCPLYETSMA